MSDEIKKGLMGVTVDETAISKVMPEINSLTYRGYAAQDLCAKCKFEEVAYLILNGDLPNKKQLKKFEKEEVNERTLSKSLINILKQMPKKSHPMDVARTAVSIMGLEDKETTDSSPEANMRKAIRILAKILITFFMFDFGELSLVSLSSRPIILTAVLATSIGCAFFGNFLMSSNKVFDNFLSFLSTFSKAFNCFLFGSSPFKIK